MADNPSAVPFPWLIVGAGCLCGTVSAVGDKAVHTSIQCGDGSHIFVWNLAGAALILHCPAHMKAEEFPDVVLEAVEGIGTGMSCVGAVGRLLSR